MIKIETGTGTIVAKAVTAGIPVDPAHPPSMSFIDPDRRWQVQAERLWMRRPWIVTGPGGYEVYHLWPTSYRPELWGRFATLQQAVDYIIDPPPPAPVEADDFDMDF
jgi:hypothetical protein|uniref:Uncharacterized protein n=1 Tax=uncultured prokaryote TaxID=198431 RepID=A0A0H5Q0J3_9ZZZZ|nr:hypothetical protein [uncultured prokaryote]